MSDIEIAGGYYVLIRDNKTGQVVRDQHEGPWYSHSINWWSRHGGNGGCDCNRGDFFHRANGMSEQQIDEMNEERPDENDVWAEDPRVRCGNWQYQAIKAVFPDGREIIIDGEIAPPKPEDA